MLCTQARHEFFLRVPPFRQPVLDARQISQSLCNLEGVFASSKFLEGEPKFPLRIGISACLEGVPAEPSQILRAQILPRRSVDPSEGRNDDQEKRRTFPT